MKSQQAQFPDKAMLATAELIVGLAVNISCAIANGGGVGGRLRLGKRTYRTRGRGIIMYTAVDRESSVKTDYGTSFLRAIELHIRADPPRSCRWRFECGCVQALPSCRIPAFGCPLLYLERYARELKDLALAL